MNKTEHYQLNKPEQDDFYNIDDMNENMDIIENAMLEFENFHHGQMVTIDTDWNNIEPGMHAVNGGSDKSKTWSKELNGPNGARLIGVLLCIGDTASKNFTQIYNEGFVSGIASRRTFIRTCIDGVYGGWMIMASVADVSTAVAKIVADAPADFDTLKEMSDWIAKHQSDASAMNSAIQQNAENIENMTAEMTAVKKSVSDGKKKVATAITDKGKATDSNASFQTMSDNIRLMAGIQYGAGVTAADNRANPNSTNYKTGYNAGITYADGRANTASTNYKTGYNAGITYADGRANTASTNYKTGYNAGYKAGLAAAKKNISWKMEKDYVNNYTSTILYINNKRVGYMQHNDGSGDTSGTITV